jgi:glutaredoxin
MGIAVTCPNGHQFKVKDKYAGKKGLCPYCEGQVLVRVPDALSSRDFKAAVHRAAAADRAASSDIKKKGSRTSPVVSTNAGQGEPGHGSSVFDEPLQQNSDTSGSLLGSSVIRHNVKCKCGEHVPMWFARCPKCGEYMPQR